MNTRLAWSIARYFLSLLVIIIIGAGIFLWWAVGTTLPKRALLPIEQPQGLTPEAPPKNLVVASYNIGHGQGIKEHAWDYRDKDTTIRQLSLVADAISSMKAHIVLLQEVDLDSNRTFHINEIEFILKRTKYPYHACALVWEKNYLPFPFWPLTHQLGFVRAANCVISRFPLSNHQRIVFDKPESNAFWYNWGYIDRAVERVDVEVGSQKLALLNVHLESWESAARELQIKVAKNYIDEIDLPIIFGGDFNTIPPQDTKRSGFADDPDADYANEGTLSWFYEHAKDLKVPSLTIKDDIAFERYTFPSDHPDRRLDHIFLLGKNLSFVDFRVFYQAGTASDHLPVIATINYRDAN
ncbi:MAG TPA: endonuclease/exonuclease/phosphatase family protein [Myxococcota bacterium]|nr:endonuclease/exonuclease/phosphatase family protein [Myxococcota bacterium]